MFPQETKILLVGDVTNMRQVIRGSLHALGYDNVVEASENGMAWQLVEKEMADKKPFQLILSDWNIATPNGLGLLKQVRSVKALANVPVIFITSETDKNLIMEAIQAGVSSLVLKPFSTQMLHQKLEAVYVNLRSRLSAAKSAVPGQAA